VEAKHPDPEGWKAKLPPQAYTADTHEQQRFHTNRVWRQILTDLPLEQLDKTREARACLLDTVCETTDYLRFFKEYVTPCVIQLNLPQIKTN
jgi:hypothetical protein